MPDFFPHIPLPEQASSPEFDEYALRLFRHQAEQNEVYRSYLYYLKVHPEKVKRVADIPFMPIGFFKNFKIKTGEFEAEKIFRSSGTTGQDRSAHAVRSLAAYQNHSQQLFEREYGPLTEWVVLALLPSYIVQGDSSLVFMVEHFIQATGHPVSGFYLHQPGEMQYALQTAADSGRKVLLIGVTYALLDLVETEQLPHVPGLVVMETGGMKGRRKEIVRTELHEQLKKGFGVEAIHSEYGMTELLSQAYAKQDGLFTCPNSMRLILRDPNDPFTKTENPGRGGINLIDLANTDSCAFIETQDLGQLHEGGTFEVLGRFDNSDVRGCSLLV